MLRADIVSAARGWIETPFMPQQSRKGQGCDCAGLVIGVARELGAVDREFRIPPYQQSPNGTMERLCRQYLNPIPLGRERPGDVVMMRFAKMPQHLGILVPYRGGLLAVIHALMTSSKVVEHRLSERWRAWIVGAYAFPGVED